MELWDVYDSERNFTGKIKLRGEPILSDEFALAVTVWIHNSEGKWLITRRAENKSEALKWEALGGHVLSGENSFQGILREAKEEIGISLDSPKLFRSYRRTKVTWENPGFLDVWVSKMNFPLDELTLQKDEVCDVKWADKNEILYMINNSEFAPMDEFPFYKDLFELY